MKDFFRGLAMLTAALLIFPAVPYIIGALAPKEDVAVVASAEVEKEPPPLDDSLTAVAEVHIYDTVAEREILLTTEEYVAAALAAQLSPETETELLKAQAVLMYTYVLKRRLEERAAPTPELHGCDVATDANLYPRLALGGESGYDLEFYREIARSVAGEYLSYGGEPITVAYCFSAGTVTESAETVLGTDIPYLRSVPSAEPDAYYTTVSYTSDEVFARLTTSPSGYVLLGEPSGWIAVKEVEKTGYVSEVYLDSRFILSGSELAELLNLPSARFTFRYSPSTDRFTFTVSGSGSLVGLSQRGGNALAAQGSDYKDILKRYFTGVEIESTAPSA